MENKIQEQLLRTFCPEDPLSSMMAPTPVRAVQIYSHARCTARMCTLARNNTPWFCLVEQQMRLQHTISGDNPLTGIAHARKAQRQRSSFSNTPKYQTSFEHPEEQIFTVRHAEEENIRESWSCKLKHQPYLRTCKMSCHQSTAWKNDPRNRVKHLPSEAEMLDDTRNSAPKILPDTC